MMKALTRFWRRMINKIIHETPGLGNMEQAQEAVKRSDHAVKMVRWHRDQMTPSVEYVQSAVVNNHFREKVVDIWLAPPPRRQSRDR